MKIFKVTSMTKYQPNPQDSKKHTVPLHLSSQPQSGTSNYRHGSHNLPPPQDVALQVGSLISQLAEIAKRAAFSVGFGLIGFGAVLFAGEKLGAVSPTPKEAVAFGTFFVCAALGRILDRRFRL